MGNFNRIDRRSIAVWLLGSALYFAWFGCAVGLRGEHIGLWAVAVFLWFFNERSRFWARMLAVWAVYWMLYDSMRVAPNWAVSPVHIRDLYEFDKRTFGIGGQTLNEWCAAHTSPLLDLAAGLFYLSWVPLPLAFAFWTFRRDPGLYLRFSWCFLLVNLIGFAIYYLFPAAPPWYVADVGFDFKHDVVRSAAGLNRVDKLLGFELFDRIYTRNANVFAAVPSLHSAYPLVGWFYARRSGSRAWAWVFGLSAVGIWLAAVYLGHHYVLDVVAGISVAVAGQWAFERLLAHNFLQ